MRNYNIKETIDGDIVWYKEGDKRISFPAIKSNSHYQEYLRYTAWVEAGNNPEDFWTQTDELSEPKEGEG